MMDSDIRHPDAKGDTRSSLSGAPSNGAEGDPDDDGLHREIEALIPCLTRYARVLTRDVVGADDLVQECLSHALAKIHLWQKGTNLRGWLFTILHHQHVSLVRRLSRERAGLELHESSARLTLSPDQDTRLELRDLRRALAKLPEGQRSVILLVGLEDMRYDEATLVANVPVGTVRSRLSRGRESLRKMTGLFPGRYPQLSGRLEIRLPFGVQDPAEI
jgi:RNA polymerase sigma-70 factor, ECF subfamily